MCGFYWATLYIPFCHPIRSVKELKKLVINCEKFRCQVDYVDSHMTQI